MEDFTYFSQEFIEQTKTKLSKDALQSTSNMLT